MDDLPLSSERAARRRAILDAAIQTFAQHGFFASRTREIAARAGVAEGTLYLYFESKDDLLLTAFRESVREFSAAARMLLQDEMTLPERLTRFVEMQLRQIEENPALATILLLETRHSSKFYGEPVRDVLRDYAAAVDELLGAALAAGELRDDLDIPLARRMLIGTLEEVELDWLLSERRRPLAVLAPTIARTLCAGIAVAERNG